MGRGRGVVKECGWPQAIETGDCTNLVIYLLGRVGQLDVLHKVVALLLHLLALGPVVEGTGDVHLLGGVRPVCSKDLSAGISVNLLALFGDNGALQRPRASACHAMPCRHADAGAQKSDATRPRE